MEDFGSWRERTVAIMSVAICLGISGCQNRFGDSEPDGSKVSVSGISPTGMKAGEDLDKQLLRIEDFSNKIKRVLNDFRRIQKARLGTDVYTQLDFLFDLDSELKKEPTIREGDRFVRYGKLEINSTIVQPECRTVQTKLQTLASVEGGITDSVVYYIKTCKTQDYVEAITLKLDEVGGGFRIHNRNLRHALADVTGPTIKTDGNCSLVVDGNGGLAEAKCENLVATLSESERLIFSKFAYSGKSDPKFIAEGDIFENETPKYRVHFSLDQKNRPNFRWEAVGK